MALNLCVYCLFAKTLDVLWHMYTVFEIVSQMGYILGRLLVLPSKTLLTTSSHSSENTLPLLL